MTAAIDEGMPGQDEALALYEAVGWSAYTRDPPGLMASLRGSHTVITARDDEGRLVGLLRTISDGHTVVYIQDILVHPAAQRAGVGAALIAAAVERSRGIRQLVLLTDAEDGQRAFYEAQGFTEAHEVTPAPLRAFVRLS